MLTRLFTLKLHWQILIALALATVVGLATGKTGELIGIALLPVYKFVGALFLNALKMLIVPLVISSMISGMLSIGGTSGLGRLGGKTILYYFTTTLFAVLIGLVTVQLMSPGYIDGQPVKDIVGLSADSGKVAARVEGHGAGDLFEVFLRMVPPNVVAAAAQGQMLGLIVFSLLFGYFMTRVQGANGQTLARFWQGTFEVMMRITDLVLKFAPLGVFGLVAAVVAESGVAVFGPLAWFVLTVLLALLAHFAIVLPMLLYFIAGVSAYAHYRAMAPALMTAFSTASSSATLPVTMECVEKKAGVSNRVSSFVLPLGATINMDGTALYECVAVLFIAQAYGVTLGFADQFVIVILALLTSVGVAGIPAASLVAIVIILERVGLPAEAIGLILAVDRILDMCRTSVNVFSDSCGAVVVGRLEGEKGILRNMQSSRAARTRRQSR